MFSKEEAAKIKKEFWTSFGKSFPRKWILYDTKIKDFAFKFYCDNKKAEVSVDIEMKDEIFRNAYYEKLWSLEGILEDELKCEVYKVILKSKYTKTLAIFPYFRLLITHNSIKCSAKKKLLK